MNTKATTLALAAMLFCCGQLYSTASRWTWNSSSSDWNDKSNWITADTDSGISSDDTVVINDGATVYPFLQNDVSIARLIFNGGWFFTNSYNFTANTDIIINGGKLIADNSLITAPDMYIYDGGISLPGNKINISDDIVIDGGLLHITQTNAYIQDDLYLISGFLDLNVNDSFDITIGNEFVYEGGSIVYVKNMNIENFVVDFDGIDAIDFNINISTSMQFINGIIKTSPAHLVVFDNNASATGASAVSHISGPVKRLVALSGNTTFEFPIGNDVVFAPIEISDFNQARPEDYFTAQYFGGGAPFNRNSKAFNLDHISGAEYWMLDRNATSGTPNTDVKVRLSFDEINRSGIVDVASQLRIAKWDGSTWLNLGKADSTGNNTVGSLRTTARVTSFSPFTLASATSGNPLPVKLINFHALAINKSVKVMWTTTSEINDDYFIVEKSIDGINWASIGKIEGAQNSSSLINYEFTDLNPINGAQYYRLLQADMNGEISYSNIAAVTFNGGVKPLVVSLSPNPANTTIQVMLSEPATDATIRVFNSMGMVIMELENQSGNKFILDMTRMDDDLYTIEIRHENGVSFSRFIKD